MDIGRNVEPPILPGCTVLPPMESDRPTRKPTTKETTKRTATGRFAVLNNFVDFSLAGLSKSELAAWLILYRDTRNGTVRTSHSDIARRAGVSVRAIATAMKRLENRGFIKVIHRGGLRRGASRYQVVPLGKLPAKDHTPKASNAFP